MEYLTHLQNNSARPELSVVLQNGAIRAIEGSAVTKLSKHYSKLGIVNVRGLVSHRHGVLAFKVVRKIIHATGSFDFISRPVRSKRRKFEFEVPSSKNTIAHHSLSYRLPAVCNQL